MAAVVDAAPLDKPIFVNTDVFANFGHGQHEISCKNMPENF